jgi:hypothetical protein
MNLVQQVEKKNTHLRASLLVTQQLNADLLAALRAIAQADALDAAQGIACAAIAIAAIKETDPLRNARQP